MLGIYMKRGRGILVKGTAHNTGMGFVLVPLSNQKSVIQPVTTTECVVVGWSGKQIRDLSLEGQCECRNEMVPTWPSEGHEPILSSRVQGSCGGNPENLIPEGQSEQEGQWGGAWPPAGCEEKGRVYTVPHPSTPPLREQEVEDRASF